MAGPQQPPPTSGLEDTDRGPSQIAMWWSEFAIVTLLIAGRVYIRSKTRAMGIDDWMIVVSWVIYAITCAMVTHIAAIGGFRHMAFLTPLEQLEAVKWNWASQAFGIFLYATSKASVALLIIRILGFKSNWRKVVLYITIAILFIFNSLQCILQFVQCMPPRALWTPGLPAKCWAPTVQENIAIAGVSFNAFIDFFYALLPVTIIWGLNMSLKKKIFLCSILSLGILAGITGIIKARYLVALTKRMDFTWYSYDLYAWTAADIFLVHFCACVPPLRPLFDKFVETTRGSSYIRASDQHHLKPYSYGSRATAKTNKSTSSTRELHAGSETMIDSRV